MTTLLSRFLAVGMPEIESGLRIYKNRFFNQKNIPKLKLSTYRLVSNYLQYTLSLLLLHYLIS